MGFKLNVNTDSTFLQQKRDGFPVFYSLEEQVESESSGVSDIFNQRLMKFLIDPFLTPEYKWKAESNNAKLASLDSQ